MQNLSLIAGQVCISTLICPYIVLTCSQLVDLEPGYPIGYRQPIPAPSVSERTADTRTVDTPSNTSPLPIPFPILAEEMGELKDVLREVIARLENVEAHNRQLSAELAVAQEQAIANKAQISLLSSQTTERNEEAYSRVSRRLDEFHNTEISMIRDVVTSCFGQVFHTIAQAHPNVLNPLPPFDDGPMPSTISPQYLNDHPMYDHHAEPPSETIFTSMLTDPTGILASNPRSPTTFHHLVDSTDRVGSNSPRIADS